ADGDALAKLLTDFLAHVGAPPFPVKVVHNQQLVALMVGYENAEAALGRGNGKSLAGNAAFKASMAGMIKDPVVALYADYERLLGMINKIAAQADPDFGRIWPKLRDAFGIGGLKRIVLTSGFDGKDWGTIVFVEAPER